MNNIKIKVKCSYCNKSIIHYSEPSNESDNKLMNLLIKDNTALCKGCANNTDTRIWLSEYIMNSR